MSLGWENELNPYSALVSQASRTMRFEPTLRRSTQVLTSYGIASKYCAAASQAPSVHLAISDRASFSDRVADDVHRGTAQAGHIDPARADIVNPFFLL